MNPLNPSSSKVFLSILLAFLCLVPPLSAVARVPLQVEVLGLEDPLKQNVLNFLDIEKNREEEALSVRWIKRLHKEAPEEIREALQPYGYYIPVIKSRLTEVNGKWLATYVVDKGEPVEIVKRDVKWIGAGADKAVLQKSVKEYQAATGGTLIHSEYESAKSRFLNIALSAGYPKARIVKNEVLVDLEKNNAAITIILDTGPLYYFGDIRFKQDFLTTDLLEYYITIEPGTPYSHESLLDFQQNLIASSYAREVTIEPLFAEAEDQKVPLDVILKPILPHRFIFGIGYETDVGIRGSGLWSYRLINRHGHHSDLYLKLSEKERELKAEYFIPVLNRLTDRWVSTASYEYEEKPSTTSDIFELETAFVRRNLDDSQFYKGFLLRSIERFIVGDDPEESTELLIAGTITRFSETEEGVFPRKGYYLSADVRGAAEAIISDTSFVRLHLKGAYMLGLGKKGRLTGRLETGAAWVDDFNFYPPSLRYFAGGDNSVRGYSYESLGPKDEDGVVVGGKQIITWSLEYDHRLAESWVLAGFVDAGNAYNDELDKMYTGAGFGFRWLAPFGSLRVDLAWPVSENPGVDDVRLHIGFGATL